MKRILLFSLIFFSVCLIACDFRPCRNCEGEELDLGLYNDNFNQENWEFENVLGETIKFEFDSSTAIVPYIECQTSGSNDTSFVECFYQLENHYTSTGFGIHISEMILANASLHSSFSRVHFQYREMESDTLFQISNVFFDGVDSVFEIDYEGTKYTPISNLEVGSISYDNVLKCDMAMVANLATNEFNSSSVFLSLIIKEHQGLIGFETLDSMLYLKI